MTESWGSGEPDLRAQAVKRLRDKRDLAAHVLAYVMVNGLLVVVWWMTAASFFWPVIPMLLWGIGVVFHAWDVLTPGPSERRIQREVEALRARR
jgi:2TM domain